MSAAKYTYYKLDVDLAASVNPATFQVHTTMHADDQVVAVFLNGQLLPGSQLADSWAGGVHVSVPSTFTIANQWRTGANELVVQVFNNSATVNPASARKWGGFALEASTASCTTRPGSYHCGACASHSSAGTGDWRLACGWHWHACRAPPGWLNTTP